MFWSTTACIHACNTLKNAHSPSSSFPFHSPTYMPVYHLSAPIRLSHSLILHLVLSCLVFPLAAIIRFTFAMLFAHPLYHSLSRPTQTCVTNPVLFPIYRPFVLLVFFFFLSSLIPSTNFPSPSWNFPRFPAHLILTPPRRLSVKMEKLKSGNT